MSHQRLQVRRTPEWYFSAAISSGDKSMLPSHQTVLNVLKEFGTVVNGHIGLEDTLRFEEEQKALGINVHDRDFAGLDRSIALVGDISLPTTGGGAEIDYKVHCGDPVLLVHHVDYRASRYLVQWAKKSNPPSNLRVEPYQSRRELHEIVRDFAMHVVSKVPPLPGAYIVIEGGEGSGKGTQTELLGEYLKKQGFDVIRTREPGGTTVAESIRDIVKDPSRKYHDDQLNAQGELLLFEAARTQVFDRVIIPALTQGAIVLSDRNCFSTVAYQGFGRKLGLSMIDLLNHIATRNVRPDLGFIIDIDPLTGLAQAETRDQGQHDRFQEEQLEFHQRIRKGYLTVAQRERNVHVISYIPNGVEMMQQQIRETVDAFLKGYLR